MRIGSLRMTLASLGLLVGCSSGTTTMMMTGTDAGGMMMPACNDLSGTYTLGAGVGTACSFAEGNTFRIVQDGCSAYLVLPGGLESTNGTVNVADAFTCSYVPASGTSIGLEVVGRSDGTMQLTEQDISSGSGLCIYDGT